MLTSDEPSLHDNAGDITALVPKRRPLTPEELHQKNHQIQKRCIVSKADGKTGPVNISHISRILNPDHPRVPSLALACQMAKAISKVLEREVTVEDLTYYLKNVLGKSIDCGETTEYDNAGDMNAPVPKWHPLTSEELHLKNHQIQKRCIKSKPDGKTGPVDISHISRILNPGYPHLPSLALACQMAKAISEVLEREVTVENFTHYLKNKLGKPIDWGDSAGSRDLIGELTDSMADEFDPASVTDARERTMSAIVRRRGQPAFRQLLLNAYGQQCAISGCDVVEVLEAAHIVPYQGPETNIPANGLLFRSDLHTLFDLGLIAIDSSTFHVVVAPELNNTIYSWLKETPVQLPDNPEFYPSTTALDQHRESSGI